MFQWFDALPEKAYPLSPCCYETQSGEGGGTGAGSGSSGGGGGGGGGDHGRPDYWYDSAPKEEPLWKKLGFDSQADYDAATAQGQDATTYYKQKNFQPNYQMFTPEQLAQSGVDLTSWFDQNRAAFDPNNTMGDLSQALAGSPIATGYLDWQGKFVGTPFAGAGQAYQLRQLAQTGPQMTDLTSSQPYQGLTDILQQMRNTQPMTAEQRAAYGEQMMGLGAGSLQGFNQQLASGIGGMQGMSDQEKTLYQRQIQQQIDSTRQENREIMGALAGAGRSIAAYDAMETAASQIADFTIQSQLELINNDWAKKQLEYQALKDQRDMIVQTGMQGSEQYEQRMSQLWNDTMSGYAQQITTIAQENQQYFQQFELHAKSLYDSMLSDIGLTQAAMDQSAELWAQSHMDELLAQSEEIIADLLKG